MRTFGNKFSNFQKFGQQHLVSNSVIGAKFRFYLNTFYSYTTKCREMRSFGNKSVIARKFGNIKWKK